MNIFERILIFLQGEMEEPQAFGWFHLMWIAFIILFIVLSRKKNSEKNLKVILGIYGFTALTLEILKQLTWSINLENGIITWNYQWYAFPFQLCTTPIIISLVCFFLKDGKLRDILLSYMAYITILGGLATVFMPDSCFVNDILVNIHTMWLHCGSVAVSIYLFVSERVKLDLKHLLYGILVFIGFVIFADILNIIIYNSGILNGETFNMFYISPYFISELPVFDSIQRSVPYPIYLVIYVVLLSLGGVITYLIGKLINLIVKRKK